MWIVFLIIIYVIVAGVFGGVFLHCLCDDLAYFDAEYFQSAAIAGFLWPFTLGCGITYLVIIKNSGKER